MLLLHLLGGCAPLPMTERPEALRQDPVQTVLQTRARPLAEGTTSAAPAAVPGAGERGPGPRTAAAVPAPVPARVASATTAPPAPAAPPEPRFDLIVNQANARDVFLALVAESPQYNLMVHPDLGGQLSLTLRRVTLREALEAIREVHGYDFRFEGRRITVLPPQLQTRVFTVNYLHSQRKGRSEVRVSSGAAPTAAPGAAGSTNAMVQPESSALSTEVRADLWAELDTAVKALVGRDGGRSVIVSPHTGLIAVRAMPEELRQIEQLLRATRLAIQRQVMLDVKIVQVELSESFQSGIDWSLLKGNAALGSLGGSGQNALLANDAGLPVLPAGTVAGSALGLPGAGGGLFGLSIGTTAFQSVLGFLETQGEVQTLSSPRLATLNNQKAVLKVGTDDYFVTNVSGGTVNNNAGGGTNNSTTLPTLTLTPFFSGVALDVTPQIDEGHMITLHVHPSVSTVSERSKQVDLGALGSYKLPLASSSINETDTVVRIPDGQIVAIGGLMEQSASRQTSGLPGSSRSALGATVLGNRGNSARKKELVVLIRPSIIRSEEDWQAQTDAAWQALQQQAPTKVIRLEGAASPLAPTPPGSVPPAATPPATTTATTNTLPASARP
ncbi:pilus (MSHA type) biogenesis protein MshL [Ideonella livida]|uniref:General secretion pathway protein GspD n=1 Tax=Ideonella livida TaxID=2707176 RepID=A0A7C9PEN3_9BURK|nr:pilus (MSHA type) biogenesis protein MshL [Ideonella livida]NDY89875.1 general secretion pathway protein GspD [Ideonella livida]